jgi:acyl carrier protein
LKGEYAMDRTALRQILREMVENNTGEPLEQFDDETDLRTGLGLDSVDVITLAMEIQDRLKVTIAASDFESLRTVGDLVELLHSRLGVKRQAA